MAYTRINWRARQGTNLNKFTKSAETAVSVILTNAPNEVTDPGTPISVENLNHMDEGIAALDEGIAALDEGIAALDEGIAALDKGKAPLDSPAFINAPTAPTPAESDNSAKIATTAFVNNWAHARRTVGEVKQFLVSPTNAQLLMWRLLPLDGGYVPVTDYPDLTAVMYVGDANNQTADWWYRFDTPSDPNGSRNISGAYLRVADLRGMFLRGNGANSKYTMGNNSPYDGGAIGKHIGDAIRNIAGQIESSTNSGYIKIFFNPTGPFKIWNNSTQWWINPNALIAGPDTNRGYLKFDASCSVPTALENRPGSVSGYYCISY
jgi:hypothetical protein